MNESKKNTGKIKIKATEHGERKKESEKKREREWVIDN